MTSVVATSDNRQELLLPVVDILLNYLVVLLESWCSMFIDKVLLVKSGKWPISGLTSFQSCLNVKISSYLIISSPG